MGEYDVTEKRELKKRSFLGRLIYLEGSIMLTSTLHNLFNFRRSQKADPDSIVLLVFCHYFTLYFFVFSVRAQVFRKF